MKNPLKELPSQQHWALARDDQLRPCDLVLEELVATTANTSPEDQVPEGERARTATLTT